MSSTSPYPGGEAAPDPRNPATDPWDLSEDWLQSLRLMHHYSTSTRHVLPKDACTEELWKTAIPEMACSHVCQNLTPTGQLGFLSTHPFYYHEDVVWMEWNEEGFANQFV